MIIYVCSIQYDREEMSLSIVNNIQRSRLCEQTKKKYLHDFLTQVPFVVDRGAFVGARNRREGLIDPETHLEIKYH